MTTFLNWVFAQAAKVYDWFGDAYVTLRTAAANAWAWAVSQATAALNAAIAYAYRLAADAYAAAVDFAREVQVTASLWFNAALSYIQGAYDYAAARFNDLVNWFSGLRTEIYNWAARNIQAIADIVNNLPGQIYDFVIRFIQDNFNGLVTMLRPLFDLLSFLDPANIQALFATVEKIKNGVMAFLDNPVQFILDMIWYDFMSFLCFVLAHGLGTVESDLPQNPPWKK